MLSILDTGIVPAYQHIMDDLINSIIEGDVVPAVPTAQAQPKTRRRRVAPAAHVVPTEEVSACAMATSQVHRDTLAALVGGGQTTLRS